MVIRLEVRLEGVIMLRVIGLVRVGWGNWLTGWVMELTGYC